MSYLVNSDEDSEEWIDWIIKDIWHDKLFANDRRDGELKLGRILLKMLLVEYRRTYAVEYGIPPNLGMNFMQCIVCTENKIAACSNAEFWTYCGEVFSKSRFDETIVEQILSFLVGLKGVRRHRFCFEMSHAVCDNRACYNFGYETCRVTTSSSQKSVLIEPYDRAIYDETKETSLDFCHDSGKIAEHHARNFQQDRSFY